MFVVVISKWSWCHRPTHTCIPLNSSLSLSSRCTIPSLFGPTVLSRCVAVVFSVLHNCSGELQRRRGHQRPRPPYGLFLLTSPCFPSSSSSSSSSSSVLKSPLFQLCCFSPHVQVIRRQDRRKTQALFSRQRARSEFQWIYSSEDSSDPNWWNGTLEICSAIC